jgi:uncharacterized protein YegJ (DUF2314 family)
MFRALALLIALSPVAALAEGDPTVTFETGDATMAAAVEQAKATLPLFMEKALDKEGYSVEGMFIKVAMPTVVADPSIENIWVGPFAMFDPVNMAGLLANEPNLMGDVHLDDRVDFTSDMIVDWSFVGPDGLRYGNYTTRVVVAQLPKDEAAPILASFPDNPVPADWR